MLQIYFIRHSESVANQQGVLAGQSQSPLSEEGVRQATWLQSKVPDYDMIYSSTLQRAVQTAVISTGVAESELIQSPLFNERGWGTLIGAAYEYSRELRMKHTDQELNELFQVETEEQMTRRINDSLEFVITDSASKNYSNVIVFCHGGYIARLHQILEEIDDRILIENMDIVHLELNTEQLTFVEHIKQYQNYLTETQSNANPHTF